MAEKRHKILVTILIGFVLSVCLAVLYYFIFALFFDTDEEARLRKENRLYKEMYPEMLSKQALVENVLFSAEVRDNDIYKEIFKTDAPGVDPTFSQSYVDVADSLNYSQTLDYVSSSADRIEDRISKVEANLDRALAAARADTGYVKPPYRIPVKLSYVQVGASVGEKMNLYYKVPTQHNGVDLVVPQGDPVFATADGTVTSVTRSHKGEGNVVEISHAGGYVTRYTHLGDIAVSSGQSVKAGHRIAEVGMSGSTYAPHLHYEIHHGDRVLDPVACFLPSVSPADYSDMLYMASHTGQSLD